MLRYVKIHSRMFKDGQERSKRPSRALKKTFKNVQNDIQRHLRIGLDFKRI